VTTVTCTLVQHLPDIRTDSDAPVELPAALVAKWQVEGRLDRERSELDAFFQRTGYPRAPRFYLMKWLTDWVRELGFDGYRVDTAKHIEETVSAELKREAEGAFEEWKRTHPGEAIDGLPFYMMGEVYGYGVGDDRAYNFGDRSVDFFRYGYDGLINFGFKSDAAGPLERVFSRYASALHTGPHLGVSFLNYVSSHDDGSPYDVDRIDPMGAGTRLLLAPGGAQIYYGDELARPLKVPGAEGDANLRSFMNWADLDRESTRAVLEHWRKLGRFRQAHRAVGAGEHQMLQASPYVFSRVLSGSSDDRVVVAMDQGTGVKNIPVGGVFEEGAVLEDAYSGVPGTVRDGKVVLDTPFPLVLLGR
jgi:alpha-amylase